MPNFLVIVLVLQVQITVVGEEHEKSPIPFSKSSHGLFPHLGILNNSLHAVILPDKPDMVIVSAFENLDKAEACEYDALSEADDAEEESSNCDHKMHSGIKSGSNKISSFVCSSAVLKYESATTTQAAASAVAQYYKSKVDYLQAETETRRAELDLTIAENELSKWTAIDWLNQSDVNEVPDSPEVKSAKRLVYKLKVKAARSMLKFRQRKTKEKQLDLTSLSEFAELLKAVAKIKIISLDIQLQVAVALRNKLVDFCDDTFFSKGNFVQKVEEIIRRHSLSCANKRAVVY